MGNLHIVKLYKGDFMKDVSYDELINRFAYFRTNAKLSIREASLRLGYNETFVKTIESKKIELKLRTLLDFCEVVGISVFDFFYLGDKFDPKHKEIMELFMSLNDDNKNLVIDFMKALKNK